MQTFDDGWSSMTTFDKPFIDCGRLFSLNGLI